MGVFSNLAFMKSATSLAKELALIHMGGFDCVMFCINMSVSWSVHSGKYPNKKGLPDDNPPNNNPEIG